MTTMTTAICLFVLYVISLTEAQNKGELTLHARVVSPYSAEVKWKDGGMSAKLKPRREVTLRYRSANTNYTEVKSRSRKIKLSGLVPNSTYELSVKDDDRWSRDWSDAIYFTTLALHEGQDLVRNLTARPVSDENIVLSWIPPVQDGSIQGYTIFYKRAGSRQHFHQVNISREMTVYEMTKLRPNQLYTFKMQSRKTDGTNSFSTVVQAKTFSNVQAPKSLEVLVIGDNQVLVRWQPSIPLPRNTIGYTIQHQCGRKRRGKMTTISVEKGNTSYILKDIRLNETCRVRVASRMVHGTGLYTKWESFFISTINTDATFSDSFRSTVAPADQSSMFEVTDFSLSTSDSYSKPLEDFLGSSLPPFTAPPSVTLHQASNVSLGGDANITCKASGVEAPTIEWFIESDDGDLSLVQQAPSSELNFAEKVTIAQEVTQDVVTSVLFLYNITKAGDREVKCVARNMAGTDEEVLQLVIDEPPKIQFAEGMTVDMYSNAQLICEILGKKITEVKWVHVPSNIEYHQGVESQTGFSVRSVRDETRSTTTFVLSLHNTSLAHEGAYKCVAKSLSATDEAFVTLRVKVPPPPPVYKIQTIALSPTRISVSWLPPLNYPYNINYYQVSYRGVRDIEATLFNTSRVGSEIYNLQPNSSYLVGVTAGTPDGLGEVGPLVEITTLSNHGLQPINLSAIRINSSMIQLTWETNVAPMYIQGFNIYYRNEDSSAEKKLFTKENRRNRFNLNLDQKKMYIVRVSTLMTWDFEANSSWIIIHSSYNDFPKANFITSVPEMEKLKVSADLSETGKTENRNLPNTLTHSRPNIKGETLSYLNNAPSVVKNVRATPISPTEIHVRWEAPDTGHVTKYNIKYWRPGWKEKFTEWIPKHRLNFLAKDLIKNSNYRFEILPYAGDVHGEAFVIFAKTFGDKPEGPPKNVQIKSLNSSALLASWHHPDPDQTNGLVIGYKLVLREKEGNKVAGYRVPRLRTNYTFLNIPTTKIYSFRMAAMTVNGTGVFSPWIDSVPHNEPTKPSPPEHLLVVPSENSLRIQWKRPSHKGSALQGYIVGYGQFIPEVYRQVVSASQTSFTLTGLKADSEYIVSVRSFNTYGESLPTFNISRTQKLPFQEPPLLTPVKIKVESMSPKSLKLSWVDPSLSHNTKIQDGRSYMIRYSSISGEAYSYVNTSAQSLVLSDLEPGSSYEVSIKTTRGSNSSQWSLAVVNSTQELAPSTAPENIQMYPQPGNMNQIYLSWSEPMKPNGVIENYFIYMSKTQTHDMKLWKVMVTNLRSVKIKNIEPYTIYYFKLQAKNKAGYGPLSDLNIFYPPTDKRPPPSITSINENYSNTSTTVKITWIYPEASKPSVIGFLVYYTDDLNKKDSDWQVRNESGYDHLITDLYYNTTYHFKVRAKYNNGIGQFGNVVSYTTPPYAKLVKQEAAPRKNSKKGKNLENTLNYPERNNQVTTATMFDSTESSDGKNETLLTQSFEKSDTQTETSHTTATIPMDLESGEELDATEPLENGSGTE
ncbi:neogenin-like [Physella acuta]|uniref:neogenin-like n=1 Tax=Physella acuta TaxID=109671 RepID=UPI0027DCB51A|nr:neogenin-like [Physella acuta]